jgi:hypothetical protein
MLDSVLEQKPDPSSPSIPPYNPSYNPDAPPQQEWEEYDIDYHGDSSQNGRNSHRASSTKREVGGAAVAAGIAGLAVSGPILGVAAGGTAAYVATTQSNSVGSATRRGGEAVAAVGDKVREADKRHGISEKSVKLAKSAVHKAREIDEKHEIVYRSQKFANRAVDSAKDFNEKHHLADRSKGAAKKMASSAKDFNEKHHVTEKTKEAASVTSKMMMEGVMFVSSKMKKTSRSGTHEPVDIL